MPGFIKGFQLRDSHEFRKIESGQNYRILLPRPPQIRNNEVIRNQIIERH